VLDLRQSFSVAAVEALLVELLRVLFELVLSFDVLAHVVHAFSDRWLSVLFVGYAREGLEVSLLVDLDCLEPFVVGLREAASEVVDSLGEDDRFEKLGLCVLHLLEDVLVQAFHNGGEAKNLGVRLGGGGVLCCSRVGGRE
jgi:hypothetical protein